MDNFPPNDDQDTNRDWYDSHDDDVHAPPPSLADVDIDEEDLDEECSVATEGSDCMGNLLDLVCQMGEILEMEMISIQQDLHELIVCLDQLLLFGIPDPHPLKSSKVDFMDEIKNAKHYLIDDEITGCRGINWQCFGPLVDEIISDLQRLKHLNRRTNDVVRRIRAIAALEEPLLKQYNFHFEKVVIPNRIAKRTASQQNEIRLVVTSVPHATLVDAATECDVAICGYALDVLDTPENQTEERKEEDARVSQSTSMEETSQADWEQEES